MSSEAVEQTTLLLARHGQSTWNAERRWQGQADPPLSDFGRQQAYMAALKVGTVDIIASSPQERALSTASIISEQIGVGPIVVVDDLRERSAGPWSGMTRDDIEADYPGWVEDGRRPDDYEADAPLVERVTRALGSLVAEYAGATILVICHGGVIKAFEEANGVDEFRTPNLAGRIVVTDGRQWHIGERLRLLDDEQLTGGDPHRL